MITVNYIKARIHPKVSDFTEMDDAWSWLGLLSAIILHLERQFIGISARCTVKHNTNQHSTGKLIYRYILFRNLINSVWAPCDTYSDNLPYNI